MDLVRRVLGQVNSLRGSIFPKDAQDRRLARLPIDLKALIRVGMAWLLQKSPDLWKPIQFSPRAALNLPSHCKGYLYKEPKRTKHQHNVISHR